MSKIKDKLFGKEDKNAKRRIKDKSDALASRLVDIVEKLELKAEEVSKLKAIEDKLKLDQVENMVEKLEDLV